MCRLCATKGTEEKLHLSIVCVCSDINGAALVFISFFNGKTLASYVIATVTQFRFQSHLYGNVFIKY